VSLGIGAHSFQPALALDEEQCSTAALYRACRWSGLAAVGQEAPVGRAATGRARARPLSAAEVPFGHRSPSRRERPARLEPATPWPERWRRRRRGEPNPGELRQVPSDEGPVFLALHAQQHATRASAHEKNLRFSASTDCNSPTDRDVATLARMALVSRRRASWSRRPPCSPGTGSSSPGMYLTSPRSSRRRSSLPGTGDLVCRSPTSLVAEYGNLVPSRPGLALAGAGRGVGGRAGR
jgi:hypothetical protein